MTRLALLACISLTLTACVATNPAVSHAQAEHSMSASIHCMKLHAARLDDGVSDVASIAQALNGVCVNAVRTARMDYIKSKTSDPAQITRFMNDPEISKTFQRQATQILLEQRAKQRAGR